MKVGVAQILCLPGEVEQNIAKVEQFARDASAQGCDLLVCPEMVDTGYDLSLVAEHASSWEAGPVAELKRIARENSLALIVGVSERVEEKIFNAVVVLRADGAVAGSYRKTHLFPGEPICEDRVFTAGDSFSIVELGDWKLGIMICYDLRFPEIARTLALNGANCIVMPTAWPMPRKEHLKTIATTRAIENQLYFIYSNRVGEDGGVEFAGSSRVIGPRGELLCEAAEHEETLIIAELNHEAIQEFRDFMPFFQHRRDDLYG